MGEDTLQVELPEVTGEASGSRGPRRRGRRVPLHDRIEPLRPMQDLELDRHRRLHGAVRQNPGAGIELAPLFADVFRQRAHLDPEIPEVQPPPQPQPILLDLHPVRAGQHLQGGQEAPQQHREGLGRHHEDNWLRRRRLLQQPRALVGKFAGNNLRNPRPAALPDDPVNPIPRLQGNRTGRVRMDPADRGRVDEWRRGIPGPEDGAVL